MSKVTNIKEYIPFPNKENSINLTKQQAMSILAFLNYFETDALSKDVDVNILEERVGQIEDIIGDHFGINLSSTYIDLKTLKLKKY